MFKFDFKILNLAIIFLLILLSFAITFILKANLKIKYQKIALDTKEKALNVANDILKAKKIATNFYFDAHYFKNPFSKKEIHFDYDLLFKNDLYSYVNIIFLTYKYLLSSKKKVRNHNSALYLILAFSAWNFSWSFIFSNWILVIIFSTLFLIIVILIIGFNLSDDLRSAALTKKHLYLLTRVDKHHDIKSYLKYLKINSFLKIMEVYAKSLLTLFISFKRWGEDE